MYMTHDVGQCVGEGALCFAQRKTYFIIEDIAEGICSAALLAIRNYTSRMTLSSGESLRGNGGFVFCSTEDIVYHRSHR